MSIGAGFALVIPLPACGVPLLVSELAFATGAMREAVEQAAPFRFAFLSAFSVPRSRHPRPSDARSPSQNPLRASQEVRTPVPIAMYGPPSDCKQKTAKKCGLQQCIRPLVGALLPALMYSAPSRPNKSVGIECLAMGQVYDWVGLTCSSINVFCRNPRNYDHRRGGGNV